jgi:hypothetical protein
MEQMLGNFVQYALVKYAGLTVFHATLLTILI